MNIVYTLKYQVLATLIFFVCVHCIYFCFNIYDFFLPKNFVGSFVLLFLVALGLKLSFLFAVFLIF